MTDHLTPTSRTQRGIAIFAYLKHGIPLANLTEIIGTLIIAPNTQHQYVNSPIAHFLYFVEKMCKTIRFYPCKPAR